MNLIEIDTYSLGPEIGVVKLSGELDIAGADDVEESLLRAEEGHRTVVIDLTWLSFIDSTGLRLFLQAHERLNSRGKRLVLTRGPEKIAGVFRTAGLDSRLNFVDSVSEVGKETEEEGRSRS